MTLTSSIQNIDALFLKELAFGLPSWFFVAFVLFLLASYFRESQKRGAYNYGTLFGGWAAILLIVYAIFPLIGG